MLLRDGSVAESVAKRVLLRGEYCQERGVLPREGSVAESGECC